MSTAPTPAVRNATWMTVEEVCVALDCCERTCWKHEAEGKIPAARRRGKRWTRWLRSEVAEFVRTGQLPKADKP